MPDDPTSPIESESFSCPHQQRRVSNAIAVGGDMGVRLVGRAGVFHIEADVLWTKETALQRGFVGVQLLPNVGTHLSCGDEESILEMVGQCVRNGASAGGQEG